MLCVLGQEIDEIRPMLHQVPAKVRFSYQSNKYNKAAPLTLLHFSSYPYS